MTGAALGPTLGIVVCCRDEERVIARRLANLAASQWPASQRPHRVIVVDDGSRDATARLAATFDARAWPPGVRVEVLENRLRPGKSSAIATGVLDLEGSVDLVVLTDADVVHAPDALVRLAEAFERDLRIGMACGAQRFVGWLPEDGSTQGLGSGSGGDVYDRLTDVVRALESRFGRVFSVHGQLLAWRARLKLCPRPALAADDLDLMAQARAQGARVVRVPAARFFEVKLRGSLRRSQSVRRARAYLQFTRTLDQFRAPDIATRWQWHAYERIPSMLPGMFLTLVTLELTVLVVAATWLSGYVDNQVAKVLFTWLPWILIIAPVLRLWRLCLVILEARRLEGSGSMDARWSTTR